MKGEPTGFWAKIDRNEQGRVLQWHPLADHCVDVAAVAEALLDETGLGKRLATLGGQETLTGTQVARLAVLAGLHDLGKANHGFQNKAFSRKPLQAGHVLPVLPLVTGKADASLKDRLLKAMPAGEMVDWFDGPSDDRGQVLSRFLMATVSHHGGLPPKRRWISTSASYWMPNEVRDPFAGIEEVVCALRAGWPQAFEASGPADRLPTAFPFIHAFAGLVMLADWLGSDAGENRFTYRKDGAEDRVHFARATARRLLAEVGLAADSVRSALPEPVRWSQVFAFDPRPAQRALAQVSLPSTGGTLAIIEAETGSGKTEAAFFHFLRLFRQGKVDSLYFALPTRSAATQIHGRLVGLVRRAFGTLPVEKQPPVVLAVPGYLRVDDREGVALPDHRVLWPDEREEGQRWVEWQRAWAAENRKRYLAGPIVAGTVDQVELSVLPARHAHLRTTALLRSLLVVDEVHASDPYMTTLLEGVVARQLEAHGHVLLMSATLGSSARERFLRAAGLPSSGAEPEAWPYPCVLVASPGAKPPRPVACEATTARQVEIVVRSWGREEVADRALAAAGRGARVLIIRNTVREAVALQRRLEKLAQSTRRKHLLFELNDTPTLHHSRFAPSDRKRLDQAAEQVLQPGPRPCEGRVLVATQTIEQSLDVDADWLITDLAPADVLLQRLGRLHRHAGTTRPPDQPEFAAPRAVVLVPEQDLGELLDAQGGLCRGAPPMGLGTVYENLLSVLATAKALGRGQTIRVPEDCRNLVEAATNTARLQALAEAEGGPWPAHFRTVLGTEQAKKTHAHLTQWRWENPYEEVVFDRDLQGTVATRLGERDVLLRLCKPVPGPFGHSVSQIRLPGWLVPSGQEVVEASRHHEPTIEVEPVEAGGFRFEWAGRCFVYDRFGVRAEGPAVAQNGDDVSP